MEDHANVLHRILDVIKQPSPKGEYSSTVLQPTESSPDSSKQECSSKHVVHSLPTSKPFLPHIPSESSLSNSNHMPQLSELSLAGGTVHTDRLLTHIEDLSNALKNFAPALRRLRLPICSNYTFKVR